MLNYAPHLGSQAAYFRQFLSNCLLAHYDYVRAHGEDMLEVIAQWRQVEQTADDWSGEKNRAG